MMSTAETLLTWSAQVTAGISARSTVGTTSTAAGASRTFSSVFEAVTVMGFRLNTCSLISTATDAVWPAVTVMVSTVCSHPGLENTKV